MLAFLEGLCSRKSAKNDNMAAGRRNTKIVHCFIYKKKVEEYRRTAVSTGNTFQDLSRLRETADNAERYI
jgi:hypothetical protein